MSPTKRKQSVQPTVCRFINPMEMARLAAVLRWVHGAGHVTSSFSNVRVGSAAIAHAVARTLVVVCFQAMQLRSQTLGFDQELMVWSESPPLT
ncbi:hypothetical protein H6F75_23680 [Nodosilinea sp. FACHB-131]|uniref:hypothetical protein n=1 Tax=Leptolyngbya subtilissima TaxID=1346803 RepID=UPI001682840D|nr:hypothetical protein [Nodosilinea sp. FACHB-131]